MRGEECEWAMFYDPLSLAASNSPAPFRSKGQADEKGMT